jgi:hypothetical protein
MLGQAIPGQLTREQVMREQAPPEQVRQARVLPGQAIPEKALREQEMLPQPTREKPMPGEAMRKPPFRPGCGQASWLQSVRARPPLNSGSRTPGRVWQARGRSRTSGRLCSIGDFPPWRNRSFE